jgi:uncharacterized membrane protein YedE/YeeE
MNEPFIPWYIAGPLIGLMVPALLIVREKQFGLSSSYRTLLSRIFKKIPYFNYDYRQDNFQIQLVIGIFLAGLTAHFLLPQGSPETLSSYGKIATQIYSIDNGWFFLFSGILVGFGARYANGCTAGHCIMGMSQFSVASLVSTICFFIGGLISSHYLIPVFFE